MLRILLFLVIVACIHAFNFEIAKRIEDNVAALLSGPKFPLQELAQLFRIGALNTETITQLQQIQFSQITVADPPLDTLYAGFENGMFSGYSTHQGMYMYAHNSTTTCGTQRVVSAPCLEFWGTATNGAPNNYYFAFAYDPKQRPWYLSAKANGTNWSPVYTIGTEELAITYSVPLRDENDIFLGVAGADFFLVSLDSFLVESYSNQEEQQVVFILDSEGILISASVRNVSTKFDGTEWQRVPAVDCEQPLIRESAKYLASQQIPSFPTLAVHNNLYIQTTNFTDNAGIDWRIVVVRTIDNSNDHIVIGSTAFCAVVVIGGVAILVTIVLGAWVVRFRRMQLWKAAQPWALMLVLASNMMCVSCTFVLLGPPTDESCLLRQWFLSLSVTLTCGSFLAKMFRIYVLIGGNTFHSPSMSSSRMVAMTLSLLLVQCVVQAIWTALGPMRAVTVHRISSSNEVVETVVCTTGSLWGVVLTGVVVGVLFICGGRLAFLTRRMSESFAESRALALTFYHGALLTVVLVVLWRVTTVSMQALTVFVVMALLWFTITAQGLLFAPRIFRQLTHGDFSKAEMRVRVKQHLSTSVLPAEADLPRCATDTENPDPQTTHNAQRATSSEIVCVDHQGGAN